MIPQTIGAVLAFLGLVAPGLLFQLLRERRLPTWKESTFHEASRVALMSLGFTLVGLAAVALMRAIAPDLMPDPGRWIQEGYSYVRAHYHLIASAIILELTVACAAAVAADQLVRRRGSQGRIRHFSIWFQVLRADRPERMVPWVVLTLDDGTDVSGYLAYFSDQEEVADREIALWGPGLGIRAARRSEYSDLDEWACVVIRGDKVARMKVMYLEEADAETDDKTFSYKEQNILPAA